LHRKDGPAKIWYDKDGQKKYEEWYKDGKHHREDGPAFIRYDRNGQKDCEYYYLNGEEVERKDLPYIKEQMDKLRKILEQRNQNRRIRL
jgi:antitoxin component YwqK of YwqJK toxin-antitoxin module